MNVQHQQRPYGEDETEAQREEKLALLQAEEGAGSIYQTEEPAEEHVLRHGQGRRVFLVLLPTIFLPCFLFTLATAITDPVLPLVASQLGGSAFVAGLSVSVDRIMTVAFSLPASTAIQRLGAPATMALGAAVGGMAALAAAAAGSVVSLVLALFVIGAGNAMWKVTRTSQIGVLCPPELRGRAIAFNTGVTRLAQIIGPAAGGFVEAAWPMERSGVSFPLMLRGVCNLLAALFVVLATCPKHVDSCGGNGRGDGDSLSTSGKQKERSSSSSSLGTFALVRKHRAEFLGAGVAATLVLGCNMCRRALVPMVGTRLGLQVEVIGIAMTAMGVFGLGTLPLAGWLMDAKGRKTAGLPGFLVLATGFGMLAAQFSAAIRTGLPGAVALMLSASLIGVGTGLTGSLNEVLCVDVAPKGVDQPKFVGVWRMMTDTGAVLGPGLAGLVAGHFDVFVAAAVVTAACGVGALALWSVKLER